MKPIRTLLAASAMLGCVANAANAITLTGDTVGIEISGSGGISSGVNTQVAGPGEDGNFFFNQFYDFDAGAGDLFTIRSTGNYCGIWSCGGNGSTVTLTLTGLDFDVPLTSVAILNSIGGAIVSSFTANSVVFQWTEAAIPNGIYFEAQFNGAASVVPVPAALPLLLTAVGGLGVLGARRRKAKAAAA